VQYLRVRLSRKKAKRSLSSNRIGLLVLTNAVIEDPAVLYLRSEDFAIHGPIDAAATKDPAEPRGGRLKHPRVEPAPADCQVEDNGVTDEFWHFVITPNYHIEYLGEAVADKAVGRVQAGRE
jgi:hypothetical protein